MSSFENLDFLAQRLSLRAALSDEDRAAVSALPFRSRILSPESYLIREGDPPRPYCSLVLSGFAFRHKMTADGARQIVAVHLAGDLLDLQHLFLNIADHSVQALTKIEIADIERDAVQEIALTRPAVTRALWVDGLVDSSIYREWLLNVGRRGARARIAHLLCEIAVRMHAAGTMDVAALHLPMTQEQLGDATGLTSVHVNRTLKALAKDGVIKHSGRSLTIQDWNKIRQEGDFNPRYLHLGQVSPHVEGPIAAIFSKAA